MGMVRHIVKDGELRLSLPEEATVEDLLKALTDRYGDNFRERIFARGNELSRSVKIFINNEAINGLGQSLRTQAPGAPEITVMVFSSVSGG